MLCGFTTRSAPARRSFSPLSWLRARATMNRSDLSARALSVMNEFAASPSTAATSAAARSIPAARRTESSVASPTTTRCGTPSRTVSSSSTMTSSRPAATTSPAIEWPTRPHPQMMTWSCSDAIDCSMRRLPSSSLRRPSMKVSTSTLNAYRAAPAPTRISTMVNTWPVRRERLDLAEADGRDRGDRLVHRVEQTEAERRDSRPSRRPTRAAGRSSLRPVGASGSSVTG